VRPAKRPRRSDAPLNAAGEGRTRHAWLAGTAVVAVLAAAAARLLPVSEAAIGAGKSASFRKRGGRSTPTRPEWSKRPLGSSVRASSVASWTAAAPRSGPHVSSRSLRPRFPEIRAGNRLPRRHGPGRRVTGEPTEIEEDLGRAGAGSPSPSTRPASPSPGALRASWPGNGGAPRGFPRYPTGLLRPDLIEFFDLSAGRRGFGSGLSPRGGRTASSDSPSNRGLPAWRVRTRPGLGRSSRPSLRLRSSHFSESSREERPRASRGASPPPARRSAGRFGTVGALRRNRAGRDRASGLARRRFPDRPARAGAPPARVGRRSSCHGARTLRARSSAAGLPLAALP